MAGKLHILVLPSDDLDEELSQRLFAKLVYTRELPKPDPTTGKEIAVNLDSSIQVEFNPTGQASIVVEDRTLTTPIVVHIETAQGVRRWSTEPLLVGDRETTEVKIAVPKDIFESLEDRISPTVTPLLLRAGRFVRFNDRLPDFSGYRLFVAPVRPADLAEEALNPQPAAARTLLGREGEGDIDDFEVIALDPASVDAATATALGFRDATVRADGAFEFSLPIEGDEIGWVWMLVGSRSFAGYQVDRMPTEPRTGIIIILPIAPAGAGDPAGHGAGEAVGPHPSGTLPLNFDEQQLIENPLQFGDDPGRNCLPFENPQRILGERRFFTVLRVDQPDIGAESSLVISHPIVLDLAPPLRSRALASEFTPNQARQSGDTTEILSRSFRIAAISEAIADPASRVRALLEKNVGETIRNRWRDWIRTRARQRALVSARNPIEWEGDPTLYQASSVAGGHILEWRVQWRSNGYSLGDVAHTLTLAPRQTRRIAKVSWRRRELAVRREITEARDEVSQATFRERDYSEAVQSSLSEWSKGGSKSSTTGAAGGFGLALGPVVIGGGAAHGSSASSSWQSGGRRVAASEEQSLRDAIRQFGESVRRVESTIVTEVQQAEEVEGVSEVIRNVNYCHALTVLYHEILRHYRVDTGFAGLRECLFVPFSITPFDIHKALKWRDKLRQGMLARHLRWALDRLDEVATAWVDSDVHPGRRSQHPINYLTGALFVRLSLERPRDKGETEAEEAYLKLWTRLSPILGVSVNTILQRIRRREIDAEAYFQREIAPTMAAKWADRLRIAVGGVVLENADFTLASEYRYGGTVRIDFTVPIEKQYTRENFQQITISASDPLPIGSVANLNRISLRYFTDHFDTTAESVRASNDINKVDTGDADPQGALAFLPLTNWEQQDFRRVIEDAVDELIVHLNSNLVYYHKVCWWLMDRDELYLLLDGFIAPYGRRFEDGVWVEDTGRSIASVVEREPIGILGNTLVFRVAAGVFLGVGDHPRPETAHDYYFDSEQRSMPLRVSLTSEGLYAQALMDACVACEEHFGSTDWVLSDKDPELESLVDQLDSRRASPEGLTPTPLPETIISLQNAPAAPDPTGLGSILQAVTKSDAFRDMAGLAGTQANALGALNTAAGLAQGFGQMAVDFQKSKQATSDAKHKLSNIKQAQNQGLIDEAEAKRQAAQVLSEQNMTPASTSLTQEAPLTQGLHNAGQNGQPIEVMRTTPRGVEMVKIGRALGDVTLASTTGEEEDRTKKSQKLPTRSGSAAAQAWESLAPIAPRVPGGCPGGIKDLGTILFIHDAETEIDLEDYGGYTNATAWMKVHTVSDLIEGLRNYVGNCGCVSGIHIEAHGGERRKGGFRMGDDDDGDGHVAGTEANDFVSTQAQATMFGQIIKNAFCPGGNSFISIASCMSTGNNLDFITALNAATGIITIGSPDTCTSGGNWWHGAWWKADRGRIQMNVDGTTKTDSRKEGTGIWKPF
jgi:hypothetical protein